jgi:DNA-binding GntR family transcriptional regulator
MEKAPKSKPSALTDWTYQYLKKGILNLDFKPGEQLHIEDFTEKLEVSRTPVREAFLRLATDGLIEVRPRVGYFVSEITEQDIFDLFEARAIVETRAARHAATALTDDELEMIKKVMQASQKAVDAGDYDGFLENEVKFHEYLQRHVHNKRLIAFMDSLNDLTYRERVLSTHSLENIQGTLVEHNRIVDALLVRDGEAASQRMAEHLENVRERLITFITKNPKINFQRR